jgi:apolipoprotein N-acyltransferase
LPAARIKSLLPWIAAVIGGILIFTGYVGFDQFYLEWICLVPVLWALRDATPRRAFLIGWLAGTVGHAGGFYWIVGMFQQFAGAPWPVGAAGLLLLAAANGALVATWSCALRFISRETGWSYLWLAPVLWTALEKLWPEVFPNYMGASQYLLPHLTQIADLGGVLSVSFLVVFINAAVYVAGSRWLEERKAPWRTLAIFAAVIVAVLCYGQIRISSVGGEMSAAEKLTVGLVQSDRGGAENHVDPEMTLREHQELSRGVVGRHAPDLIVWPEGVCSLGLPSLKYRLPTALFGDLRTPMLIGACLQTLQGEKVSVSNSALLIDPEGEILGSYDKSILVPFGEYIPLGDIFPVLYSWSPFSSPFRRGTSEEPLALGRHRLSVSICYEDIFPTKIRSLMRGGRERRIPDAMFNLTNDSWYGNSTEPMEHLALASFRSIENRRALARVTNTGISAFVDPVGRVVSRTGVWTKEVLVGRIPLMKGETVYGVLGDWLAWLCVACSMLALLQALRLGRGTGKRG